MRRLAPLAAVVPALLPAGCASTQERSAQIRAAAKARPQAQAFVVGRRNLDVHLGRSTILRDANGVAVVFPLRLRGSRAAQGRVPISFELLAADGRRVYRNDTPGLDASLVEAPVLEPRRELLWVDDQIRPERPPARARARIGRARSAVRGAPPRIRVGALRLGSDPTEGVAVKGSVTNASGVEQKRLVVFVVARRGARIRAAGRSIVPRLKPEESVKFTAFLIGDPRGARLQAAAPPTTLP